MTVPLVIKATIGGAISFAGHHFFIFYYLGIEGFDYLEHPWFPFSFAPVLRKYVLPDEDRVLEAVRNVVPKASGK